jgi:uncharacterized protein
MALSFSKHNIFSRLADSENYFLVNLLTGNADILGPDKAQEIKEQRYTDLDEYVAKGYLSDPAEEEKLFRKRYADFIDNRDNDETQIFFVPWYACNFGCDYCFQDGYENAPGSPGEELLDAFFGYIRKEFAGKKKYITIFGGEPLLPGEERRRVIADLLDRARSLGVDTAFVSNGYALGEYIPLLRQHRIREVQVTLDGLQPTHDRRRPLAGGQGTFDTIVAGIDQALAAGITINLRMVVDRQNIGDLPGLARFAIARGWTKNPRFKTQLGRNYELHYCQAEQHRLLGRIEMWQIVYAQAKEHPEVLEFHRPAFSISKFLWENGELPPPLYDSCPGTKTEWAFDYAGRIYACTATVGKPGESLGTFFPDVTRKEDLIIQWEERDVTSIEECTMCPVRLACGGGCASVAFNATGKIQSPDCRPVTGLMEMGLSLYFEKESA